MKRFNRKKLIPSLAASFMVAAATFAPLPLVAGSVVHAYPTRPLAHLFIESPALIENSGAINVEVGYRCSPISISGTTTTAGSITVNVAQATGIGTGTTPATVPPLSPAVICDGTIRETNVNVAATTGFFDANKATATATLYIGSQFVTTAPARTINVE